MSLSVIIQARLRSSRLPGKVLLQLPNRMSVLENVIGRCAMISREHIHALCLAVPDDEQGDIIENHIFHIARSAGQQYPVTSYVKDVVVVRGPEHDVLARYKKAHDTVGGDHIMRITADCPFISPDICTAVAASHMENGNCYTSNVDPRTFPKGFDCEVFTADLLRRANLEAITEHDREHVTPWMRWRSGEAPIGSVVQEKDESGVNLCIDTIDDYIRICKGMI